MGPAVSPRNSCKGVGHDASSEVPERHALYSDGIGVYFACFMSRASNWMPRLGAGYWLARGDIGPKGAPGKDEHYTQRGRSG